MAKNKNVTGTVVNYRLQSCKLIGLAIRKTQCKGYRINHGGTESLRC